MKSYTLSMAAAHSYQHPAPERTAMKVIGWDYHYQIWPNRESMAKSIRMQQRRASHPSDWKAIVTLTDGEGYGRRVSQQDRKCPHCGRQMKSDFDEDAGIWYECTNCDYQESVSSSKGENSDDTRLS